MSLGQTLVLTAIVAAFIVFAAVLAWGDYRTQKLARPVRARDHKEPTVAADSAVNKAAKSTATAQARWPQPSDDGIRHVA